MTYVRGLFLDLYEHIRPELRHSDWLIVVSIDWYIDCRKIDDSIIHALNVSTPTASIQARGVDPKGRTFNIDFIWFHHGFKMFRWTWKFPKFLWCQILKACQYIIRKNRGFFPSLLCLYIFTFSFFPLFNWTYMISG